MSGEFLRAVLDKNCLFSELAIYTLETIVPAGPPSQFGALLPCKADRYFLAMAVEAKGISNADVLNDLSYNKVELFNPKNAMLYSSRSTKAAFFGGNLNGLYNLNEYMLFEPASLIGATIFNNTTQGTPLTVGSTVCVTLYGIEYAP